MKNPEGLLLAKDNLTIRDWFAGQALGAALSAATVDIDEVTEKHTIWSVAADTAYQVADAMLAARKR